LKLSKKEGLKTKTNKNVSMIIETQINFV